VRYGKGRSGRVGMVVVYPRGCGLIHLAHQICSKIDVVADRVAVCIRFGQEPAFLVVMINCAYTPCQLGNPFPIAIITEGGKISARGLRDAGQIAKKVILVGIS
ncbi:MAG: hypothetical protein ABSE08_18985, partial [Syntrophobacteraceae bacterium]